MASATLPYGRRDRPWLFPSNRKLRNFISISLRNISLDAPTTGRRRGKTIDDDAVPLFLQSPAKIVALREQRGLEHSRSSDDLRKVAEDAEAGSAVEDGAGSLIKGKGTVKSNITPTRPKFGRMRRRSTLEWVNATPQKRQERLERLAEERMVDCFFSLHVKGLEGMVRSWFGAL
jgi:UV radiation resistance-associated gene protein